MNFLSTFAEAANQDSDIMSALGIDWRLLILQIIAFVILVWLLGKFVYPFLMKSVDEHQKNIENAASAAKEAQASAAESQAETAKLLAKARKEASVIVSSAKSEAADMLAASEERAKAAAEQIAADAQAAIRNDIEKARRELHDETLQLVALATEKVVRKSHTKKADTDLIADLLKEAK